MEEFRLTKQLSHKYSTGQTPQTQPSNRNKQNLYQAPSQWPTSIPSATGTFGGVEGTAAVAPTASVPLGGSNIPVAEPASTILPKKNKIAQRREQDIKYIHNVF